MATVADINHAHTWALFWGSVDDKNFRKTFLKHGFFSFRLRTVILQLRLVSI